MELTITRILKYHQHLLSHHTSDGVSRGSGMAVSNAGRGVLGSFSDSYQQATGSIITPSIIGSYQGPTRRTQTLVFNFHPKSEEELKEVGSIIKALRFCSLPGIGNKINLRVENTITDIVEEASLRDDFDRKQFQADITQGLVEYKAPPV